MSNLMNCRACGAKISTSAQKCPQCGEVTEQGILKVADYIDNHTKSRKTSFFLTIFLGPIGLLYVDVKWSIILIVITLFGAATVIIPLIVWIVSIIAGDNLVQKYNDSVKIQARMIL